MHFNPNPRDIAVKDIEPLPLTLQRYHGDSKTEARIIRLIGRSMRPLFPPSPTNHSPQNGDDPKPTISIRVDDDIVDLEEGLLALPMGQIAPIRLLKYPEGLDGFHKPYGLIFGNLRYEGAKAEGLETLQAQVLTCTLEEYQKPFLEFILRAWAYMENELRLMLDRRDRGDGMTALREAYDEIAPKKTTREHAKAPKVAVASPGRRRIPRGALENQPGDTAPLMQIARVGAAVVMDQTVSESAPPEAVARRMPLPRKPHEALLKTLGDPPTAPKGTEPPPDPMRAPTACRNCRPCRVREEPLQCPQMREVHLTLWVCTLLIQDLHLRMDWTPPMIDVVQKPIGLLSTAIQTLELDLRSPEAIGTVHNLTAPYPHAVPAHRTGKRDGEA